LSTQQGSNLPTTATKSGDVANAIISRLAAAQDKMIRSCPDPTTGKRAMEVAMGLMKNKSLLECTSDSIMLAVLGVMKLGLVPDPNIGHAYIIPFKNKGRMTATLVVGYKGLIHLALRAGAEAVTAELVHSNDDFVYGFKDGKWNFEWQPFYIKEPKAKPGELIGVMVILHTKGIQIPKFVPKYTLDQRKAKSRSGDSGPWTTDTNAMYLKTGIREAARLWDLSPDLNRAVDLDQAGEDGRAQGSYIDASELGIEESTFEVIEDPAEGERTREAAKDIFNPTTKPVETKVEEKKEEAKVEPEPGKKVEPTAEVSMTMVDDEPPMTEPAPPPPNEAAPPPPPEPAKVKKDHMGLISELMAEARKAKTAGRDVNPTDVQGKVREFQNNRTITDIPIAEVEKFCQDQIFGWPS